MTLGVGSIAFPAISCGVYGYPIPAAARIAVTETVQVLRGETSIARVVFVGFGAEVLTALRAALHDVMSRASPGVPQALAKS